MRAYYGAVAALAADLLTLTALAFGMPGDWFDRKNDRPTSALRVLHYPTQVQLAARQFPASPHTDYGTWTILHKRPGCTGLEAQALDGSWLPVYAPEDGFVVNVGDLLMRWTGGHWLSTLHRVMPTNGASCPWPSLISQTGMSSCTRSPGIPCGRPRWSNAMPLMPPSGIITGSWRVSLCSASTARPCQTKPWRQATRDDGRGAAVRAPVGCA